MAIEKTIQAQVGGYVSTLMRDHFGKGPTSVYVTIEPPFITVHLRGFLAPTEQILLKQLETRRVMETRDLLMNDLKAEIKLELWKIAEFDVQELYADWDLDKKTGLIIAVLDEKTTDQNLPWPENIDEKAVYQEINEASRKAQKTPESTEIVWLNDRTVLIKRLGIFVEIEKELIKGGFIEELKLVKRPLEQRLLSQANLNALFKKDILEVFVDWNFEGDRGYMVLLLEAKKQQPEKVQFPENLQNL